MLEQIDKIDRAVFLFFNEKHSHLSDQFWQSVTTTTTWVPLYLLLLLMIVRHFRKDSIWILSAVILTIVVCDQFTSTFMKPYFARFRPCQQPDFGHLVHVIKSCGGKYGFASSHAANCFGVAMMVWMSIKSRWPGTWVLFLWAALVAISRVMVGVHYPGDIITGALLGVFFGWIIFKITEEVYFRANLLPLIKS